MVRSASREGSEHRESRFISQIPASTSKTELPERWSVQRKSKLVLRLLRGEALDAVSRESRVPAHELRA